MRHEPRLRGQSLAEFALVASVPISLASGALDMGRLFYCGDEFRSALRAAARSASKHPSVSSSTQQSMIQNEGNLPSGSLGSASVSQQTGAQSGYVFEQLPATHAFTSISPRFHNVDGIANPLSIRTYTAAEVAPE